MQKLLDRLNKLSQSKIEDFLSNCEDEERGFLSKKKHNIDKIWSDFINSEVYALELHNGIYEYVKNCIVTKKR